jgi:uncharacterized damage-inducible protein DinB
MRPDISSIKNPQVRHFYALYWPQRQIVYDFFARLTEEQFDYRMVDTPERKSDTPRESLAHILYVQLVYLNAVKTGWLEFKSMGVEHYWKMTKGQLLAEMERIDEEMLAYLTAEAFDSSSRIEVFWGGEMNAVDVLYFLRDHDILHIGWNLALMDHLNVPRFESLIQYWGP